QASERSTPATARMMNAGFQCRRAGCVGGFVAVLAAGSVWVSGMSRCIGSNGLVRTGRVHHELLYSNLRDEAYPVWSAEPCLRFWRYHALFGVTLFEWSNQRGWP